MTKKCEADPAREKKRKADRERLAGKMRRLAVLEEWYATDKERRQLEISESIQQEAIELGRLRMEVHAEVAARDFWIWMSDKNKAKVVVLEGLLKATAALAGFAIGIAGWLA